MPRTHGDQVSAINAAIDSRLGEVATWEMWPGGWPGQIEMCLVDAIFSANAKYGRPATEDRRATGVHAVLASLRSKRSEEPLDDLKALATLIDRESGALGSRQLSPGTKVLKDETVRRAAEVLLQYRVRTSVDLAAALASDEALRKGPPQRVPGVGSVTWEYFLMLAGHQGIKADRMVVGFVNSALDDALLGSVDSTGASQLLKDIAAKRGVAQVDLDHAIWSVQRKRHDL